MKRISILGAVALTLGLVACQDESIDDKDDTGAGGGVSDGGDDGGDEGGDEGGGEEGGGVGGGGSYFTPVAVGFELWSGYDTSGDDPVLSNWKPNGTDEQFPYVIVTFADIEYFGEDAGEDRTPHYCELYYAFDWYPSEGIDAYSADYDSSSPYSGRVAVDGTWAAFEGQLYLWAFDPDTQETCEDMNPDLWPGGTIGEFEAPEGSPYTTIEGMRYGVVFGEVSDYLAEGYWGDSLPDYEDYLFGSYTAINHQLDNGDIEFVAYDWTSSLLFQWEDIGEGPVTEENEDGDSVLVGVDSIRNGNQDGIIRSFAYWYEDFPLIHPDEDISILVD